MRPGIPVPVLVLLMNLAACSPPAQPPAAPPALAASAAAPGQALHFTGTGSVTGKRQTLAMGATHPAEVFRLGGSLMLSGDRRPGLAFRADLIGYHDGRRGMVGSGVWTDEQGDQVFSELRGSGTAGALIEGRITGGTGRFAAASGNYRLHWRALVESEDGSVSGRLTDLEGWARLEPPALPSSGARP